LILAKLCFRVACGAGVSGDHAGLVRSGSHPGGHNAVVAGAGSHPGTEALGCTRRQNDSPYPKMTVQTCNNHNLGNLVVQLCDPLEPMRPSYV